MNVQSGGYLLGRELEFFHHESGAECGYAQPQIDTFAVLHPKDEQPGAHYPLYVVFHSAGHDVYSAIVCTCSEGNHDIYHAPEGMYALYLDCRANMDDWWWGGINAKGEGDPCRRGTCLQPVEKRCLATVAWVMEHYPIEKNRVYAVGNSMGGSGALGIGLGHGDLFAAIVANVPAGVEHACDRCLLGQEKPAGFKLPDPPVVVDYSAPNDGWSAGHEKFYAGMAADQYALVGYWGAFGHANDNRVIHQHNDLVHCFDALSLRLDEAYPAFTGATTDDVLPWPDHLDDIQPGQVNAFFRWRNIADTSARFDMALRLMRPDEWRTSCAIPQSSIAAVTLRRVQQFILAPHETVAYAFGAQSGRAQADAHGVLTLPALTVTQQETILTLTRV